MAGDVIVTVTLNAALHVDYTVGDQSDDLAKDDLAKDDLVKDDLVKRVSRPGYRAGGRGVTAARVLHAFGHDVLAAGLAGGSSGELIREDLARSGVPTAFTGIRGESRRLFRFTPADAPGPAGPVQRFGEPGPYITTEELGRFAADYRRLLSGAAAVVLCGSLPDGLPTDTYGSLVTYAAEAGVPVILDAGGEELKHGVDHGPDLVVAQAAAPQGTDHGRRLAAELIRLGATAATVATGSEVHAVTGTRQWTARLTAANQRRPTRGALVAGLVPGQLLGWSWPDRLRHALALSVSAGTEPVDLIAYERLLDAVTVAPSVGLSCSA